jgi:hypothetical protein
MNSVSLNYSLKFLKIFQSLSRKIHFNIFSLKTPSASLLTCRKRPVDTPQTLTQTLPLTLIDQGGFWSILFDAEA